MDTNEIKSVRKGIKAGAIAGRNTDPLFFSTLQVLPNPDPILRRLGRTDNVYDAIASDAHIRGEMRAIRAGLLTYKIAVNPGSQDAKEKAAAELCQEWFKFKPAPGMTWPDIIWNMGCAVFKGYRAHELVWDKWDNYVLPVQVLDVPNRRIVFSPENELRLLTKEQPVYGIEVPDYKFLLSRHMPSAENPYGEALFASCFWPYTFKHGGWKFFYKFCERFGQPWPIGKYPFGTPENDQNDLLRSLEEMVESGCAIIPEGDSVELLQVTTSSGDLAQERLIALCNKEMSMALTSQSIITNQQSVGSFASTQTSRARETSVNDADISIIESTFNIAFEHITRFNFGEDVLPPTLTLHKDDEVDPDLVKAYAVAASVSNKVDLVDFHQRTGIKMAADGAPTLTPARATAGVPANFSSSTSGMTTTTSDLDNALSLANGAIADDWIKPAFDMLTEYEAKGKTLKQYLDDLPKLYGKMDDAQMQTITSSVMKLAMAKGMQSTDG